MTGNEGNTARIISGSCEWDEGTRITDVIESDQRGHFRFGKWYVVEA